MSQSRQIHRPPLRHVLETYVAVTGAAYTAKAGDRLIGVNRSGVVTITLPTAQVRPGRIYTVKDESGAASSNNITVATEGSETIDGSATDVISVNYAATTYYSDGTNWFTLPLFLDTDTQLTLATTVSTQAHGDSSAGGSASTASKGDHKHGMPAAGGGADISASVYKSGNQSLSNSTMTSLTFNTEDHDTDTIHDTGSNTERLTAKTAGMYHISGRVEFAANATGFRWLRIRLNGTTDIANQIMEPHGTQGAFINISMDVSLAANDYVELRAQQSSGGALNVIGGAGHTVFAMHKVLG